MQLLPSSSYDEIVVYGVCVKALHGLIEFAPGSFTQRWFLYVSCTMIKGKAA